MFKKLLIGLTIAAIALSGTAASQFSYRATVSKAAVKTQEEATTAYSANKSAERYNTKKDLKAIKVYNKKGKKIKLSKFIGKPMIINCWATWCGPCKSELPHFQKCYKKYKDDVKFIMIDVWEDKESQKDVKKFLKKNKYKFPVYFDYDNKAADTFGLEAIPFTVAIDKDGYLVDYYVGAIDKDTLEDLIKKIK